MDLTPSQRAIVVINCMPNRGVPVGQSRCPTKYLLKKKFEMTVMIRTALLPSVSIE